MSKLILEIPKSERAGQALYNFLTTNLLLIPAFTNTPSLLYGENFHHLTTEQLQERWNEWKKEQDKLYELKK